MKLTPAKIKECAEWVEKHGLHPQPCGASVGDFCKAMGIGERTAYRWFNLAEVAEALNAARDKFAARIVFDVENALVKAALGLDAEVTKEKAKAIDDVIREYDPATGRLVREHKTKKLVTMEATRERRYYPPDVKAAQFILTNMAAGTWRQKQDLNLGAQQGTSIEIKVGDPAAADGLQKAIDTGAQPAPPADETTQD
jgi:hypothetical protein